MKKILSGRNIFLVALLCSFFAFKANAQDFAVKTNALYWATTTLNAGMEARLADKWTGEIYVGYNPWQFSQNRKIKHIAVQPAVRYWLCAPWAGHFLGSHLLYSHYNAGGINLPLGIFPGLKDSRYQGDLAGWGVSYGYNFILSNRWSLELEAGLGLIWTRFKQYECRHCGSQIGEKSDVYVMPTKLAVNFVYYIK